MSRLTTKQRRSARRRERAYWRRVFPWRFMSVASLSTPDRKWFQFSEDAGFIVGISEVLP